MCGPQDDAAAEQHCRTKACPAADGVGPGCLSDTRYMNAD